MPLLLRNPRLEKIVLLSRSSETKATSPLLRDPKIQIVKADLENSEQLASLDLTVDLCLHMAGVTHSQETERYARVNLKGTLALAKTLQSHGCKKLIFLSSHTAGLGAGAYAESKFKAEQGLLAMPWKQLTILRPAEVTGTGGAEGVEMLIQFASSWRIFPFFFRLDKLYYSPFEARDLAMALERYIFLETSSPALVVLRGPEISSWNLSRRIAVTERALPVPVPVAILAPLVSLLNWIGLHPVAPDQIARLCGVRRQLPLKGVFLQEEIFPTPPSSPHRRQASSP